MFWNHRVVRSVFEGEPWLEIQEVYYNEKGEPSAYCDACLGSEDMEGIREQLERMTECLAQPILNAETDFTGSLYDGEEVEESE